MQRSALFRDVSRTIAAPMAAIGCAIMVCSSALADPPPADVYMSAAALETHVANMTNGRADYDIWSGPGFRARTLQRSVPGEVEIHARMNDIFVVQEGNAAILLGGRVDGGSETAPDERRGGTIVGGHVQALAPGDMLWIPAGEPHQITPAPGGAFRYVVVKVETRTPAAPASH